LFVFTDKNRCRNTRRLHQILNQRGGERSIRGHWRCSAFCQMAWRRTLLFGIFISFKCCVPSSICMILVRRYILYCLWFVWFWLLFQVDERAVLKHFDWPEQKADALREAAFGYCDLKKLISEASSFRDDPRQLCGPALKKMQTLLEKCADLF